MKLVSVHLMTTCLLLSMVAPARALIEGTAGNAAISDPGLPPGAIALANLKTRLAFWVGPPFGGGQYHFEYAGTTDDLQAAINLFAKVEAKRKRIVVQAGVKQSVWLSTATRKADNNQMDWQFVVWIPKSWQQLKGMNRGLLPPGEEGNAPPTVLHVHLTDRIDWSKIKLPKSIQIEDQRLEANGIDPKDGGALRGRVLDLAGKPIVGAAVRIGRDGVAGKAVTDTKGKFLITKIPPGTHQIIAGAQGYATRDARYVTLQKTSYQETEVRLAKATQVVVRTVDIQGKPLPNIALRISNCVDHSGQHYPLGGQQQFETNKLGEVTIADIPAGKLKFMSRTKEYYYNSVLNEHHTDDHPIVLKLVQTGSVVVVVADENAEPITSKYIVQVEPEGGGGVGSWGGSANVKDDGTVRFERMPPGRYVFTGRPNPGRTTDTTDGITLEVVGGKEETILIIAK